MDAVGEARSSNKSQRSNERDAVGESSPTIRANPFVSGEARFRDAGIGRGPKVRDGAETPGEGRMIQ